MDMMSQSISKISALPVETIIYCSHEYTQANGKFALSVDADNQMLISRINEVELLIKQGKPTIPTNLKLEKQTNPFLRTSSPAIQNKLGLKNASEAELFAALRAAKDNF
jgi:hydroxyacylglutathione hydrolase